MGSSNGHDGPPAVPSYTFLLLRTWRGRMAIVAFFACCQAYAIRVVMSVALQKIAVEYGYDNPTKGLILSSFFQGYIFLQLPGGLIAGTLGGFWVLLLGILLPSIATLFTPLVAGSVSGLVALRVVTGFFEGVTYPALHAMIGQWVPAHERSILTTIMWSGGFAGTFITMPVAGAIAGGAVSFAGYTGWRTAFYAYGAFGIGWAVLFALTVTSRPETHKWMSQEEKDYIISHRKDFRQEEKGQAEEGEGDTKALLGGHGGEEGDEDEDEEGGKGKGKGSSSSSHGPSLREIPWLELARCKPFWGCVIGQTTHNWGFYLLLTWLPEYLDQQLGFDVENSGIYSFLPYMVCFLGANAGGKVADLLIAKGYPVLRVRQAAFTLGEVVPAIALAAAGYVRNVPGVLALLTIAVGFSGISVAGIACTPLDMAPHLAGAMMGVMNTVGTISGIVAPIVVGAIVAAPHDDVLHWQYVFWMAAGINIVGWCAYCGWCTASLVPELQPGYVRPGKKGKGKGLEDDDGEEERAIAMAGATKKGKGKGKGKHGAASDAHDSLLDHAA